MVDIVNQSFVLEHLKIYLSVKVLILLEKECMMLVCIMVHHCLNVFLIKFIQSQSLQDNIFFFEVLDVIYQRLNILLYLICAFAFYLFCDLLILINFELFESHNKFVVFTFSPMRKALVDYLFVLSCNFIRNFQ